MGFVRGDATSTRIRHKNKAPRKSTWKALSARRVHNTCSCLHRLKLQLLGPAAPGDGAAECTAIKIQRGPFCRSPHLGFSTTKLGLSLVRERQKRTTQCAKTPSADFSGKAARFFFSQNNSGSISYQSFSLSPGEHLNPNLSPDKPTLFPGANCQPVGPKASACLCCYLCTVVLKSWRSHVEDPPVCLLCFHTFEGKQRAELLKESKPSQCWEAPSHKVHSLLHRSRTPPCKQEASGVCVQLCGEAGLFPWQFL